MKKSLYLKILSLLVVFVTVISVASVAKAADNIQNLPDMKTEGDFVVGPGKVEVWLSPGESVTKEIMVTNRIGKKMTFNVDVEDFKGSYDVDQPVVLMGGEKGPYSLKDYIKMNTSEFDLENAQRITIPVTISVPASAEPGGRYGAVLVSTKATDASKSAANVVSRIGTLFYVRIKGDVIEKASVTDFKTVDGKKLFSKGPVPMQILVKNEGSVHSTPSGRIEITNMTGKMVGVVKLDPWFVLPASLKVREASWEPTGLAFGKYTAKAIIDLGYGDKTDTKTTTFWVIPWGSILTIIVIIIVLVLLITWLVKNFKFVSKKKSKK